MLHYILTFTLSASITLLSMPIGALISGIALDKLGRKLSNIVSLPIITLFWCFFLWSNDVEMIITARFLTGIISGYTLTTTAVYIAETTDPKYRGFFLTFMGAASAIGVLAIHAIGSFVHWKITALISGLCSLPCLVIMYFVPESPQWLIKQNRLNEAENSFRWLRGTSNEATTELKQLLESGKNEISPENNLGIFKENMFWKPFAIVTVLSLTAQWSGYNSIEFYSINLAEKTFGGGEYLITIIMDFVRVIFSIVACILSRTLKRRPHTIWTGLVGGIAMVLFASLLYYKSIDNSVNSAVIFVVLLVYLSAMTAGVAHLPGVIAGELFPYKMRGLGVATAACVLCFAAFLVVYVGPIMFINLGLIASYAIYGVVCLLGSAVLYFILPETKDKSLVEIENYFK